MNFLDIPAPCWSCKVCKKKVLCGFEKCLVSKVVFYIMLDVAWNSVVVGFQPKKIGRTVSLFSNDGCVLGTQTLTNSIRSRLCFPTVHWQKIVTEPQEPEPEEDLILCTLLYFLLDDQPKQATTKSVNWAVRYNMVKIYVLWKFVPHVLLKKKVFSSIGVFLFHHFVHVFGIHTKN